MPKREYMERAIALAKQAIGFTNPNPMVGAVIVKDDKIIAEGYHHKCGELHAERNAFANLTQSAQGATLYVTLEPCCHYGKTPPCTEAIIENNIKKVVIGSRDPNPLVSGKGARILREHGIEVIEDFMREECDAINPVFFHYITTKKPYIVLKYAMTLDGKIATKAGYSKWITDEASRNTVQYMRHKYMGIMAGIGTVLADNPMLNVRIEGLKSPVRIICDSKLRIPLDCSIIKTADQIKTIVACAIDIESVELDSTLKDKLNLLKQANVQVVSFPSAKEHVDLNKLITYLGETGIDSVFVEGGGTLNDDLLCNDLVNQLEVFIAPKCFGGKEAKSPVEGNGITYVEEAKNFKLQSITPIGDDVLLSYVKKLTNN